MSIGNPSGRFSATKAGTDSGATATQAADAAQTYVVTNISGHTDADSIITIESPLGAVIWQTKVDVSIEGTNFNFNTTQPIAINTAAVGDIASSSADCQVTISGDII